MVETTPFRPFDPNAVPATADPPVVEKPDKKPSRKRKPRPSRARPPAADKATPKIPPAPKHKRPTRKKTAKKRTRLPPARRATGLVVPPLPMPKKNRKPRVQKVDLDTALSIGAMLKPSDLKVFGDIRQHLGELNKATRRRVLGAIGKVFG